MELSNVRFGQFLTPEQRFQNAMRLGHESRIAANNFRQDFHEHTLNSLEGFESALKIIGTKLKLDA